MEDPAPVIGLSPRDPLNGFAGLCAHCLYIITQYIVFIDMALRVK